MSKILSPWVSLWDALNFHKLTHNASVAFLQVQAYLSIDFHDLNTVSRRMHELFSNGKVVNIFSTLSTERKLDFGTKFTRIWRHTRYFRNKWCLMLRPCPVDASLPMSNFVLVALATLGSAVSGPISSIFTRLAAETFAIFHETKVMITFVHAGKMTFGSFHFIAYVFRKSSVGVILITSHVGIEIEIPHDTTNIGTSESGAMHDTLGTNFDSCVAHVLYTQVFPCPISHLLHWQPLALLYLTQFYFI